MKIRLGFITLLLFLIHNSYAQDLTSSEMHVISSFVNDLKYGRKEFVAKAVRFPLERLYPLPAIRDEEEFLSLYDEFIDQTLIDSLSTTDWSRVGWRGVMGANGCIWGDFVEGGFVVYSFNYQTKVAIDRWKAYIDELREKVYFQLRDYLAPEILFKTNKYIIRIDNMPDGNIRYASWSGDKTMLTKPDLVISSGRHWTEGSLGFQYYEFTNNDFSYMIGPTDEPNYDYELLVRFRENIILKEYGNIISY